MIVDQYRSRRFWNMIPPDPGSPVVILYWKISDGKRAEALKSARIFVEIFVDEEHRKASEQEKSFTVSLKGYGVVVSRRESTIDKLNKQI